MKKILIDTNFLLMPFEYGVDVGAEQVLDEKVAKQMDEAANRGRKAK